MVNNGSPQLSSAWNYVDIEVAKAICRRIGNLALIKSRINIAAGNDGFKDKVEFYKKSDFKLTNSLNKYSTWNKEQIEERQRELADLAVKAWPIKI